MHGDFLHPYKERKGVLPLNERLFKDRAGIFLILLFLGCFGNFYLVFLCASHLYFQDLLYLDLLFLAAALTGFIWDFFPLEKSRGLPERKDFSDTGGPGKTVRKEKRAYIQKKEEERRREVRRLLGEQEDLIEYIGEMVHEASFPWPH